MNKPSFTLLMFGVWFAAICAIPVSAQNTGGKAPPKDTKQGMDRLRQALVDAALAPVDTALGDYVPCRLTPAELRELRFSPRAETLTQAQSEALKKSIVQTANSDQSNDVAQYVIGKFTKVILTEDFSGRTQSQATAVVVKDYDNSQVLDDRFVSYLSSRYQTSAEGQRKLQAAVGKSLNDYSAQAQGGEPHGKAPEKVEEAVQEANKQLSGKANALAEGVRTAVNVFLRPNDVGCAMSLLDYPTTKRAYGQLVADQFIAVQIVVRNLNRDQEFQVHDAEFAVDVDPSGRHSRFYSGTDKLIVRRFSVAQESFDVRNLTVHTSQAIGSILSAIVPVYKGSFSDAIGVLTGAAIPGLDKVWKDETIDQLNLLNDTGFSSSSSERTVVPKLGVAMFVIFVPAQLFERAWWTQPCADLTYVGSLNGNNQAIPHDEDSPNEGVDIDRALEPCIGISESAKDITLPKNISAYGVNIAPKKSADSKASSGDKSGEGTETVVKYDLFSKVEGTKFKKWSGNMLNTFRELSFVVVSGAHLYSDSQFVPTLDRVKCGDAEDAQGNITLNGGESLNCDVAGTNLDQVQKLRLRNAAKQSETAEGRVSVNGDSKNGTVTFAQKDVGALTGMSYPVFLVNKSDKESSTNQTMHFSDAPQAVKLGNFDTGTNSAAGSGFRLAGLGAEATLATKDGKTSVPVTLQDVTATSFTLKVKGEDLAKLPGGKTVALTLKAKDSKTGKDIDTGATISITPPEQKPAGAGKGNANTGGKGNGDKGAKGTGNEGGNGKPN